MDLSDLTPQEIKEIKKSFKMMDENGDGRISARELLRAARLLGLNPTLQEAEAMLEEVDEDGSGYVEFSEYVKVMSHRVGAVSHEIAQLKAAFRELDTDNDGFLGVTELRQVVLMIGEKLTETELDTALKHVVIHPGDKIKYEEFAEKLCEGLLYEETFT